MIKANWKWTNDIEDEILKELQDVKGLVINVCSGTSGIGDIRIDRWLSNKYQGGRRNFGLPNVIADYRYLPIKSQCAAVVICDPPYSPKRRGKEFPEVINELVRITTPNGKLIFLSLWIPYHPAITLQRLWLRPISSFPTYKILSVSLKTNAQIE